MVSGGQGTHTTHLVIQGSPCLNNVHSFYLCLPFPPAHQPPSFHFSIPHPSFTPVKFPRTPSSSSTPILYDTRHPTVNVRASGLPGALQSPTHCLLGPISKLHLRTEGSTVLFPSSTSDLLCSFSMCPLAFFLPSWRIVTLLQHSQHAREDGCPYSLTSASTLLAASTIQVSSGLT